MEDVFINYIIPLVREIRWTDYLKYISTHDNMPSKERVDIRVKLIEKWNGVYPTLCPFEKQWIANLNAMINSPKMDAGISFPPFGLSKKWY